ncbi:DUF4304 domain-containing protein [Paenibacillus chitinolyticus]|uniref:DUF4304 domain-containing protein n=1 Tax=Paenibacillus chitinolyticus TaxID=79263 RepID=A0A410WPR6_9BACL|nr:DUF4304 domain-containing protein [Paenibacillus chitinolyticus]MCY9590994.1 DUF4304 domain-containing protein [Paenibacillus chitinolyticus]MCY9597205.1 DUF4304 domain-containing protein [Paenibacillus chitinolyticus]QAV16426.1 DUF4304 domain-containing protein [Paenibacillus chitinolyticus]
MLQQLFKDLIKQDVKPFLSKHGFAKKGLNFSKTTEGLIYLFNFQKSSGNSADNVMFYVNCGIYAAELAQIQSKEILTAPQETECHFRARIGEIARAVPDRFAITPDTNRDDLRKTLLSGLEEVIHFYETMTSARSIVDYYISGPFLHLGEESFHLLLKSNDAATAKHYLKALHEKYGAENRWTIFENKYKAIFNTYGVEFDKL